VLSGQKPRPVPGLFHSNTDGTAQCLPTRVGA
jgi:hypothetical protein